MKNVDYNNIKTEREALVLAISFILNDEYCIKTDEFFIQNDGFCIINDVFAAWISARRGGNPKSD